MHNIFLSVVLCTQVGLHTENGVVIQVPQDYRSIQAAVNAASSGDTIVVAAGTYSERIWVKQVDNITLIANGRVVTQGFLVASNANVIRGFVATDPTSNNGIQVWGNYNVIERNEIYHTGQDGIWFFGKGNIYRYNHIHDILAPSVPGDPHVDCFQTWDWDWPTIDTVIDHNTCDNPRNTGSNQSVMLAADHNTVLTNNVFTMHDEGYSAFSIDNSHGLILDGNSLINATRQGSTAIYGNGVSIRIINNIAQGYDALTNIEGASVYGNVVIP